MPTITTADFRAGMVLKLPEGMFELIHHTHTHMARGSATVRAKLRNVETGQVLEKTFAAKEKCERVYVDKSNMEYLYRDGDLFYFMDPESFEQKPLGMDIVEAALPYLKENTIVKFKTLEGRVIGIDLPDHIDLLVEDTEPGVRGDTVSGATKPATMETGVVVQVPLFVEPGEVIKVDTRSGDYLGRVGK